MKIWKEVLVVAILSAVTSAAVASTIKQIRAPKSEPAWMSLAQAGSALNAAPQRVAEAAPAPQQVVVPAPQVTVQAPAADPTQSWIVIALGAVATLIFGKNSLFPSTGPSQDPRTVIDQTLLKLMQSGQLQAPVQMGLGMIPTVGPIAAQLEPMVKQWVMQIITQRLGQAPSGGVALPGQPPLPFDPTAQNPFGDTVSRIEALIQDLEGRIKSMKGPGQ